MQETITAQISPAELASKFINQTNKNVFLTGKAGTGKTTFLKKIIQLTHKRAVIAAPTGIAAINAGGVTLHSLFQLPFGGFKPVAEFNTQTNIRLNDPDTMIRGIQMNNTKRKLLNSLDLLIIDEVSMLRADLLDAIDTVLRHVRKRNHLPFGGVQVLFIGDLLQLPPVVRDDEWNVLKSFYKSIYFFDAQVLQREKPVYIELDKIYRQADDRFIALLNNLRNNSVTDDDVKLLNAFYKPDFKSTEKDKYITLTTHNVKADTLNKEFLQQLKTKSHFFEADIENEFSEGAYPVEKTLELKTGAQVMFVKNDPTGAQRFFNGKMAVITSVSDDGIEVCFEDSTQPLIPEKYTWENVKYVLDETTNEIVEKVVGTFAQYPIKLAWAITVHKSQGLTFDKAIVDIGNAFAPGQVYVALSRLRSLHGLVLTSKINHKGIEQDNNVTSFSKTKTAQEDLQKMAEREAVVFLKSYLLSCFNFGTTTANLDAHIESYMSDEKHLVKEKFKEWAIELRTQLDEVRTHAEKFLHQIVSIIDNQEAGFKELLLKRISAAKDYFLPVFKKIAAAILTHIEKLKTEKRIKNYVKELFELEQVFYEQIKMIEKAEAMAHAAANNKEFTKEEANKFTKDEHRAEHLRTLMSVPYDNTVEIKKERKERIQRNERKPKKKNSDTKKETFDLYKQGKSILEIAEQRKLTIGTIEGHLAHYIAKSELDISHFVSEAKIKEIIAVVKNLNTFNSAPIKGALGNGYSYGEIRMVIASYLSAEKNS